MRTVRWLALIAILGCMGTSSAFAEGCGKEDLGVLARIELDPIFSPQKTCADFTVVARAYDACGNFLSDYSAPASWTDLTGALTPFHPAPFVNGISVTAGARVGIAVQDDSITITSGGVSGDSDFFDVRSCDCSYSGQWVTVQDYQKVAGKNAQAHGVTSTSDALIVAGQAYDSSGASVWTVQRSTDSGASWTTVDEFQTQPGQDAIAQSVAASGSTVYAVGSANVKTGVLSQAHWFVRKSTDDGLHWQTIQDLGVGLSSATSVAIAPNGTVYVSGLLAGLLVREWIVERSADGGATWQPVDLFNSGNHIVIPFSLVLSQSGGVYVGGQVNDGTSDSWVVRHSANGDPSTFATVQTYQLAPGESASAHGGTVDANGNILFSGSAKDNAGHLHWIIQRASDSQPSSWQLIENLSIVSGNASGGGILALPSQIFSTGEKIDSSGVGYFETIRSPASPITFVESDSLAAHDPSGGYSLGLDPARDLFAVGFYTDANGAGHWLVRKLACSARRR